jgi:probable F420-dependent oxidoreductase
MKLGKLAVWGPLALFKPKAMAEYAQRFEKLGYDTLWMPETTGPETMVTCSWLLANTTKLKVATGIANIYHRLPGPMVGAQKTLAEQSDNRFILGLGVSHEPLVSGLRGVEYSKKPLAKMREYLDQMDASPDNEGMSGRDPGLETPRVLAALGPKMLELARERTQGAHPYFQPPAHTKKARDILGPDKWLCVEQKVILETDPAKARAAARVMAEFYLTLPNYRRGWLYSGLSESDFENGGSDRFIDTTFAWGTVDQIKARLKEHFDAGATQVCVHPVNPTGLYDLDWNVLEALAPKQ